MTTHTISQTLKDWFLKNKRTLPWRISKSPYRVWVSEVMLQQTQVSVVIDYFNRWIKEFPNIEDLASAPLEKVIKCWEGLGYYSRARNLHKGALFIQNQYKGTFPSTYEELIQIPGIGPYTAHAILAFAYHKKACPVDGNIKRVISRLFAIKQPIDKASTLKTIQAYGDSLVDCEKSHLVAEGLIEFGALICKKQPLCGQCPLSDYCEANKAGFSNLLPIKSSTKKAIPLKRELFFVIAEDSIILKKVPKGSIMEGLYMPPFKSLSTYEQTDPTCISIIQSLKDSTLITQRLSPQKHGFTQYRVDLKPILIVTKKQFPIEKYSWHPINSISSLAFPSGIRQAIQEALQIYKALA